MMSSPRTVTLTLLFFVCILEAWTNLLSRPLFNYLKNDLGLDPSAETRFYNATLVPWLLQGFIALFWEMIMHATGWHPYVSCAMITFVGAVFRVAFAWYPPTLAFLYVGYVSVEFFTISSITISKRVLSEAAKRDNHESAAYWTWTGMVGNVIRIGGTVLSGYLAEEEFSFAHVFQWSGFAFAMIGAMILLLWFFGIRTFSSSSSPSSSSTCCSSENDRTEPLESDQEEMQRQPCCSLVKTRIRACWNWFSEQKAVRSEQDKACIPLWSLSILLFFLICMPSASNGVTYFVVDVGHMSAWWLAFNSVIGLLTGIGALIAYRALALQFSLVSMLCVGYMASIIVAYVFSMLIVSGPSNLQTGIGVLLLFNAQTILATPCSILMCTPFFVIGVKSAPDSVRAFSVSFLMGIVYGATVVSGQLSSFMFASLDIKTGSYANLSFMLLLCLVMQLAGVVVLMVWVGYYYCCYRHSSRHVHIQDEKRLLVVSEVCI